MKETTFLLPRNFRFVGILFFIAGILIGVARFKYGLKPDFLDLKVFAFYSSFLESKYMEVIRNNMSEELTGFFLVSGIFMIGFSREKEENEQKSTLRLKSFFIAAYLNLLFLLTALFFTYGFAFVYLLMANICFGLIAYTIAFRILLYINRSRQ